MLPRVDDDLDAVDRAAAANRLFRPVEVTATSVTRPATTASPTIHRALEHLRARGLTEVPEPLALEGEVERLGFIPGASGGDGWYHQHTDEGLSSAARLLRRIHDASQDWTARPDATWGAPAVRADEVVLCHGDPGPWNFVWHDHEAVGLIDWDYLHPGPRLDDVAYALRWFVPLRADQHVLDWHHFPEVPDRRHRVRVFLEAYGDLPAFDVADEVTRRMRSTRDLMSKLAVEGVEPQRTWVADGALAREEAEIRWVEEHRHLWD